MNKILTAIVELISALVSDNQSPLYFDGLRLPSITTTPHGVRAVFFGDPQQIPADSFPVVAVRPVSSRLISEGTRSDTKEHLVEVVIIDNLKNYSSDAPIDPSKVQYLVTMMEMMEKADADQNTSGKSIVGKLLQNVRLPYTDSGTKYAAVRVQLESVDYVFNSSRGFPTFEVIALFRVMAIGDRA